MHRYIFLIFSFFILQSSVAQYLVSPSTVKWYNIERAMELNKEDPRPIMIDVYTDWCSWCNYMMKTTFSNKGIADYINKHFYPIRFDAQTIDTIVFEEKKYINRRVGRKPTHDLATYLLDNRMSYPSLVFLDKEGKKMLVQGFKETKDIEPILVYQVEGLAKHVSLPEFTANFMYTYPKAFEKDHSIFKIPKELKPDTLGQANWVKPETISLKKKKKRKPTIVFFYADDCMSCEVMEKTTFNNKSISNLLNENFNLVKVNVASKEKFMFLGKWYKGAKENTPHQLVNELLKKGLKLPAVAFIDETGKQMNKINAYINVSELKVMVSYFIYKKYKSISYNEYLKGIEAAYNTDSKKSVN